MFKCVYIVVDQSWNHIWNRSIFKPVLNWLNIYRHQFPIKTLLSELTSLISNKIKQMLLHNGSEMISRPRSHSWIIGWVYGVNATFNNISVISWRLVLLVEETGGPGENHQQTTNLSQVSHKLHHIMLYPSPWAGVEPTTSVVIGTDYIGSWKSNYHTITASTAPWSL